MLVTDQETLGLLRESARDFCSSISLQSGRDPSTTWWSDIAGLGWMAVAAAEEAGGSGMGLAGAGVIAHELGRAGYLRGYAESVAIGHALHRGLHAGNLEPTPALEQALRESLSGEAQWAVLQPADPESADRGLVPDVIASRLLVLTCDDPRSLTIHEIGETTRQRMASTTSRARDLSIQREYGGFGHDCKRIDLDAPDTAQQIWNEVQMCRRVLFASQMVGVVRTALTIALDYSRIRSQFGKVIGSYQSVQHAVVDILATCDAAELLVERALAAIDADRADQASLSDAATAYARETAWAGLMKAYDVLGGVGFIEVHPINRYTRALMLSLTGVGSASACEDAVADHVRPGHWLVA
jgi:alkylation response protein AidB-like acyl-CoA dehydrogenase